MYWKPSAFWTRHGSPPVDWRPNSTHELAKSSMLKRGLRRFWQVPGGSWYRSIEPGGRLAKPAIHACSASRERIAIGLLRSLNGRRIAADAASAPSPCAAAERRSRGGDAGGASSAPSNLSPAEDLAVEQAKNDPRYQRWIECETNQGPRGLRYAQREASNSLPSPPQISVILPVYRVSYRTN